MSLYLMAYLDDIGRRCATTTWTMMVEATSLTKFPSAKSDKVVGGGK